MAESKKKRHDWSIEARQAARETSMANAAQRWQTYQERYPERIAARAKAMLSPQPCDTCGGEGQPMFRLKPYEQIGWRCYSCRSRE